MKEPPKPPAPPVRLPLGGGASIRFRRLPGPSGKVVLTSPDARFLLLGAADFEALESGSPDAANSVRRKLDATGFVHAATAPSPTRTEANQTSRAPLIDPNTIDEPAWEAILDRGAPITLDLGDPPHTRALNAVRHVHTRYAARGVDSVSAYLNAVLPVGPTALAAGPEASILAALEAGLVYLELRPEHALDDSAGYLTYQRAAWDRIIETNLRGPLLVEKRLALHLEALIAKDESAAPPSDASSPCSACAYDPYCASALLRRWLTEEPLPKAWSTPFCETSMGTFDELFARLASPEGVAMRRVLASFMAAQKRVARAAPR